MKKEKSELEQFNENMKDSSFKKEAEKKAAEIWESSQEDAERFMYDLNAVVEKYAPRMQPALITQLMHLFSVSITKISSPYKDKEIEDLFNRMTKEAIRQINQKQPSL